MTKTLKETDYYGTTDLGLAVAISLFYPIEAMDKKNLNRVEFLFKRDKVLDKLVEEYWRGELKIEARAYFNQIKNIKSRLYEKDKK